MSGHFRGRLNTAAARARSQLVRIRLAIGPEFVWETTFLLFGHGPERLETIAEPPELVREQPEFV